MARRRGKQFWSQQIAAASVSGVSAAAYCRQQGLSYKTFLRWRARLDSGTAGRVSSPSLMPVSIRATIPGDAPSLRLEVGGGVVLTLPPSVDAGWLGALLRAVSAC